MATLRPGPNDVLFTQYLRPHGRPVATWIERPPDVAATAQRVREAGYHFDIEELRDGTVSMTVEADRSGDDDQPIAIELVPNGPAVVPAVDRLIAAAAERIQGGEGDA